MSSKQVTGLGKLGRRVAASTADPDRNTRAMTGFIHRCSEVVPPGTTSVTLAEAQYYLGRQIEHEIEEVRQRDNDNVRRLVDLDAMRQERDQAVVEVYGTVLKTRQGFELTHGEGSGKQLLGLDTEVPDDPVRLFQTADRGRTWLRDRNIVLPEPKVAGFTFDRLQAAAGLDGPVDRLGRALEVLPREEKHTVDTLVSKMTRMRRLDQLIGRGARFTEALYDVAGMEEESDRIRQSSHKPRTEPVAGPAAEATPVEPEASPAEATNS